MIHLETDADYRRRLIHALTGHEDCSHVGVLSGVYLDEMGRKHGKPRYGNDISDPNPKIGDEVTIVDVVGHEVVAGRGGVDLKRLAGSNGVIEAIDQRRPDTGALYLIKMNTPEGIEFWASRDMFRPATTRVTKTLSEIAPVETQGSFKVVFRGQVFEVTHDQLVFEDGKLIDVRPPFRVENITGATEAQLKAAPRPERKRHYLPTLSDLVDRMTIVQLKALFIKENREAYLQERGLIEHDIDLILDDVHERGERITAADIHAIVAIMLTNHLIWINESKARAGGDDQDQLLKLTHSINGQRNAAKNKLARVDQGRHDFKLDCFAADLVEEYGHLQIF
jgi:hypothetical protein